MEQRQFSVNVHSNNDPATGSNFCKFRWRRGSPNNFSALTEEDYARSSVSKSIFRIERQADSIYQMLNALSPKTR